MDRLERDALRTWTPVRVYAGGGEPTIDWAIVERPFRAPFFEQSANDAMDHPFNAAFVRRTPLTVLDEFAADEPPPAPAGLIFHMSRCGSTLAAQMLARVSSAIVLSEAQPIDALVRMAAGTDAPVRAARLRSMVAALAGPRGPGTRVFVKLHAWHVLALPLFLEAFPDTPWAFVFREPGAVLRSHARLPGAEVVPGTLDPATVGINEKDAALMPSGEYAARTIAAFCAAALSAAGHSRSAFVDYDAMPEIVTARLLPFFGIDASAADIAAIREVTRFDTKSAGAIFGSNAMPSEVNEVPEAVLLDAPYAAMRSLALR